MATADELKAMEMTFDQEKRLRALEKRVDALEAATSQPEKKK